MSVAFVFPGQGSQQVGMGQALAAAFPDSRAVFDEADEALGVEVLAREGVTTFVEVGPGTVLSGLVRKIAKGARVLNVDSPESLEAVVAALGAGTEA